MKEENKQLEAYYRFQLEWMTMGIQSRALLPD